MTIANQNNEYINGAKAEDSVNTISRERSNKNAIIGVNHQRLEVLIKYQNSPKILKRSPTDSLNFIN
jgi:hypothetical protein